MKVYFYPVLALVLSAGLGWMIAKSGLISRSDSHASSPTAAIPPRPQRAAQEQRKQTSTTHHGDSIPLSMLQGLGDLKGSPRLTAAFWFGDETEIHDANFAHLTEWLQLTENQQNALASILREAANDRREWEIGNIHSQRIDEGIYQLTWIDHDSISLPALQQALAREFGETLGESIFIRGNLHRFFEPLSGWQQRRIPEILLTIKSNTNGGLDFIFTNGDWRSVSPQTGVDPTSLPLRRLAHLFDYRNDAEAMLKLSETSGPPVAAAIPGKAGYVSSPFCGKIIDVRGMPAGTLVADPNFPAAEKKYFRVPPPAEN